MPPEWDRAAGLELRFGCCTDANVGQLRVLNKAIFPINYSERMYQEILACGDVSQLAFHGAELVGAIGCRLENTPEGPKMYIMTLGVLAPYRGLGIGSALLRRSLGVLEGELPEVVEAFLHVQTSNEDAIRFYRRFGFEAVEVVPNYYHRLDPPDAVLLRKVMPPHQAGQAQQEGQGQQEGQQQRQQGPLTQRMRRMRMRSASTRGADGGREMAGLKEEGRGLAAVRR